METQYQQGDVFLRRTTEVPDRLVPVRRDDGVVVLPCGGVTGHRHAVLGRDVDLLEVPRSAPRSLFLRVDDGPARLVHAEHDTITLAPGWYHVIRQREYVRDPWRSRYGRD